MLIRAHPARRLAALLAVTLLVALGTAVVAALAGAAPAPGTPSATAAHAPVRVHPPAALPILTAGARSLQTEVWYTQEGSTLNQLNGSSAASSLGSLSVRIPLVKSPYPIGYELNGLSDVGDWYQIVLGDNWPGCSSGFVEITETWYNTGSGNAPVCDTTVTLSAGDLIQLGINYTASHNVCLDLADLTTSVTHNVCAAPPDSGGRSFVLLPATANANGYFTGPMTEIANVSATSCPDYTFMPLVNYEWPSGIWVTGYIAWSDEWELTTGTFCYSGGGGITSLDGTDPSTSYADTASGTSYGPHWAAGQNYSLVNSAYGWRFQTDPVPITSVSVSPINTVVPVGANVTFTGSVVGGKSPYSFLWYLGGVRQAALGLSWTWTATAPGTYAVVGYGMDAHEDVLGPSGTATVTVAGPLSVGAITVGTPTGGADVGQSVPLFGHTSGGIPPYRYLWTGLPSGCASANASTILCAPNAAGTYSLRLAVTDSNGSTVTSPPLTLVVAPALTGSVVAPVTTLDVGQTVNLSVLASGGAGPYATNWSGLPSGCVLGSLGASVSCRPATAGLYPLRANLTDANGALLALGAPTLHVYLAPTVVVSSNRTAVDVGMAVTLSATVTFGAGGPTFAWAGMPAACSAGNASTLVCSFAAAGSYAITVTATDAAGGSAVSGPLSVRVAELPALSFATASVLGAPDAPLYLNATLVGGTAGETYVWSGLPPGCGSPAGPRLLCLPTATGRYPVTLTVTDGAGATAVAHATIDVQAPAVPPSGSGLSGTPLLLIGLGVAAVAIALAVALVGRRRRSRPESAEAPDEA